MSRSLLLLACLVLASCSGSEPPYAQLTGQVGGTGGTASKASHYAASRFLEQAAMGPSPTSVADVRSRGLADWIQNQLALAPSLIQTPFETANYELNANPANEKRAWNYHSNQMMNLFVGAEDQLRVRTSWALSNFLVVSTRKLQPYGGSEYFNTLQSNAFGQYGDLLKAITRSPAMGFYLDNGQNRRTSLNENYGRELMQLFSVGLVQLNMDGTPKRDAQGKPLETYTQNDVINATRALTGWNYAEPNQTRPSSNGFNYGKPMVADFADWHDADAKVVLGSNIPAGQNAERDLDSLINILINHPNTAPFVSLRLIQGLTTSDPSPAYLQRVATVFASTKGHLGQVVKTILLDPEARTADDPSKSAKAFGRIKEPHLLQTSLLRGLGCRQGLVRDDGLPWTAPNQTALSAFSVFNFYPPNHRAPGSKLLAPEQKMLTADEFNMRLSEYTLVMSRESTLLDGGCNLQPFKEAAGKSDAHLTALLGERYFRGAMPAAVAQGLIEAHANYWDRNKPVSLIAAMLSMTIITPPFGVSK